MAAAFSANSAASGKSCRAGTFSVVQFPCLQDNYGYLLHDERTGETAAVDTPDGEVYQRELSKRGWFVRKRCLPSILLDCF